MAAGSFFTGRSRHGGGAATPRSHRSAGSGRSRRERERSGDDTRARTPDIDELRQKRDSYYSTPVSERRRMTTPGSTRSRSSKDGSERTVTVEYKKRKSGSSGGSSRKSAGSRREKNRTEEYVYDERAHYGADERDLEDDREPSVRSSRSKRSSMSHKDELPSIMEQEVTPDDSISQVAERAYVASRTRPSTRASKHQSLPVITERATVEEPNPRKSPKREGLLETIFRRKSSQNTPQVRLVECLACGSDDIPSNKAAKLECGHRMCHSCLRRVFRMAVNDPAHMPPRCCTSKPIPLEKVQDLFDYKFKVQFNKKYDEYHTKNRIYCPNSRCGTWIRPQHFHTSQGRKYGVCPKCKTKACTTCSGPMHKSRECPKDPEIARLIQQAEQEGWQRCYRCNAMVELKEGCNHMTCRCTAEFCMVCGSKWKTCECPWFNYRDLPDADRLNDMRIPEPIQVIYRRVFDAAAPRPATAGAPPPQPRRGEGLQMRTYTEEIESRRRQERLDEDLARRMQLQAVLDPSPTSSEGHRSSRHRRTQTEARPIRSRREEDEFALGNAAPHHMNMDFRRSGRGPGAESMAGFGDEAVGRRGERSSGRRSSKRMSMPAPPPAGGLVGDFLGSPSVLGMGPSMGARRVGRVR